jgi:hypothetical protein
MGGSVCTRPVRHDQFCCVPPRLSGRGGNQNLLSSYAPDGA